MTGWHKKFRKTDGKQYEVIDIKYGMVCGAQYGGI